MMFAFSKPIPRCIANRLNFVFLALIFLSPSLKAQEDSVVYSLRFGEIHSVDDNLPHYLHSNRGGIFDYDFSGPYFQGIVQGTTLRTGKGHLNYGAEIAILNQTPLINFQQIYVDYRLGPFSLFAGKRHRFDFDDMVPGMGNVGISNNARPLPKVGISTNGYWNVLWKGLVKMKGRLYHGWFEKDRYIDSPVLHEKSLATRIGTDRIFLDGSIDHYAMWGGINPATGQKINDGFSDYKQIFLGVGGTESTTNGNHLGYWHWGVTYKFSDISLELYTDAIFEDGRSWQFWNLPESKDRVVGLNIRLKKEGNFRLDKISFEYLTTVFQQGAGLPDRTPTVTNHEENFGFQFGGRDDNYNNFLYQDGWTHANRIIGNPLFIDRALGQFYFGIIPDYEAAIVNNRITAFHIGVTGAFKGVNFKFLSTFSKNFGTYAGLYQGRFEWRGLQTDPNFEYTFHPALKQAYFLLEGSARPFKDKNWAMGLSLAYDRGELTDNFGALLNFTYTGFILKDN